MGMVGAVLLAAGGTALAQTQGGNLPLVIGQGPGGSSYSVPIQTLLFFTALGFIPAVLLLMTSIIAGTNWRWVPGPATTATASNSHGSMKASAQSSRSSSQKGSRSAWFAGSNERS